MFIRQQPGVHLLSESRFLHLLKGSTIERDSIVLIAQYYPAARDMRGLGQERLFMYLLTNQQMKLYLTRAHLALSA